MTFPSWWKPEDGPPVRFLTEAEVPKNWTHVPGDYDRQTGQWVYVGDINGLEGFVERVGTDADNLKAMRAQYKAKFGKRPFNGWDEATLREKLG